MFEKYQHVERLNHLETDGLLLGTVHVFYKLDGTNASLWWDKDSGLQAGSRNRHLTLDNDNAGFYNWAITQEKFTQFFEKYPEARLYGEWLVPHSLKTYRDEAWRDFYVFDVVDRETGKHISYDLYRLALEQFGINYVPALCVYKNPSIDNLHEQLQKCGQFLVKDGEGQGEGIVLKNYDFVNRFGRTVWAKLITNEFKERHHKEMGAPVLNGTEFVEQKIVDEYLTDAFLEKEKAKLELLDGPWTNKHIPKFLGIAYYEFIREESWNFIKNFKNPTIDYKLLNKLVLNRCKKFLGL